MLVGKHHNVYIDSPMTKNTGEPMPLKVIQPDTHADTHNHAEHPAHHVEHPAHRASPPPHAPPSALDKLNYLLVAIVALLIVFNGIQLFELSTGTVSSSGPVASKTAGSIQVTATNDVVNDVIKALIPTGTPEQYGQELGISFDDPVPSLTVLAKLDRAIPTSSLTPEQKTRYIATTSRISCEYCCSAPAVADSNGRDLCGCSHALAIRGLAKYLVTQHPDDWTDDQIYWEVTRWKALFFPKNMVQKGVALVNNNMELTAPALNDLQLLKKISTGATDIGALPNMVGGC